MRQRNLYSKLKKRGLAQDYTQLSKQQDTFLHWLAKEEKKITNNGIKRGGVYSQKGIKWYSKRFFPKSTTIITNSMRSSLSRSIKSLAERGLIKIHKGKKRTRYVKITEKGLYAIRPSTKRKTLSRRIEYAIKRSLPRW